MQANSNGTLPVGRAPVYALLTSLMQHDGLDADAQQQMTSALPCPTDASIATVLEGEVIRFRHGVEGDGPLLIEVPLGPVPERSAAQCMEFLLKMNFAMSAIRQCVFTIDPEDNEVVYVYALSPESTQPEQFSELVRSLVALAPHLRLLLREPTSSPAANLLFPSAIAA